jgi:hypothetical protein
LHKKPVSEFRVKNWVSVLMWRAPLKIYFHRRLSAISYDNSISTLFDPRLCCLDKAFKDAEKYFGSPTGKNIYFYAYTTVQNTFLSAVSKKSITLKSTDESRALKYLPMCAIVDTNNFKIKIESR